MFIAMNRFRIAQGYDGFLTVAGTGYVQARALRHRHQTFGDVAESEKEKMPSG